MNWKVNFLSFELGCTTPEIPAGNEKNHEKQEQSGCLGRFQLIAADILVSILQKKYTHKAGLFLECLLPYITLESNTQLRYANTS
jgi:hypothetical protein